MAIAATTLALVGAPTAGASPNENSNGHANGHAYGQKICPAPTDNAPSCMVEALARPASGGGTTLITSPTPIGFGPAQFHGAYNVPTTATGTVTVAIIVGYDNPNVKADLDVYNSTFGLPPFPSCSTTVLTSCFQKIAQSSKITTNPSWTMESSLDVQTIHQMCQNCKILLVEGNNNYWSNLMWAVDTAVSKGATVVNNSYAGVESSGLYSYDSHFNVPGVAFTAGSGDNGFDVRYPAASKYVTGVGGTTLTIDSSNNWVGESVWKLAGSGCSLYEPKPVFQTDTGCANRTVSDVSADADSDTGAAIYNSAGINGQTGWFKLGGTSLSAPIISAIYAMAGVTPGAQENRVPYVSGNSTNLHDVSTGSNGTCGTYLCQGTVGFDGPTGLGTPNGLTAFR